MGQVKFGRKQLGNPVPQSVGLIADFIAGFCGIVAGFMTTAAFVPHSVSDIVSPILTALLIPTALYVKRFFGTSLPPDEPIDPKDVAEIKDSAIPPPSKN